MSYDDYDDDAILDSEAEESAAEAADPLKRKLRQFAEARRERDMAKLAKDRAEKRYRAMEAEIIAMIEESGMKGKMTFDFGELGTVSFMKKQTIFGRVLDLKAAIEALQEEELAEQMTVPKIEARRLNELVRERLENGEDLPPGLDFYEKKFISISGLGGDE